MHEEMKIVGPPSPPSAPFAPSPGPPFPFSPPPLLASPALHLLGSFTSIFTYSSFILFQCKDTRVSPHILKSRLDCTLGVWQQNDAFTTVVMCASNTSSPGRLPRRSFVVLLNFRVGCTIHGYHRHVAFTSVHQTRVSEHADYRYHALGMRQTCQGQTLWLPDKSENEVVTAQFPVCDFHSL